MVIVWVIFILQSDRISFEIKSTTIKGLMRYVLFLLCRIERNEHLVYQIQLVTLF